MYSYIRMNVLFSCCFLIMSILTPVNSQRHLNLRDKLERLLKDPSYNDVTNEIHKPRQIQGMLLRDHDLFDTSSEERFFRKLSKSLQKISAVSGYSDGKPVLMSTTEITGTTTNGAPTSTSETANEDALAMTAMSQQKPPRVIGSLGSIISKLIELWRN